MMLEMDPLSCLEGTRIPIIKRVTKKGTRIPIIKRVTKTTCISLWQTKTALKQSKKVVWKVTLMVVRPA